MPAAALAALPRSSASWPLEVRSDSPRFVEFGASVEHGGGRFSKLGVQSSDPSTRVPVRARARPGSTRPCPRWRCRRLSRSRGNDHDDRSSQSVPARTNGGGTALLLARARQARRRRRKSRADLTHRRSWRRPSTTQSSASRCARGGCLAPTATTLNSGARSLLPFEVLAGALQARLCA